VIIAVRDGAAFLAEAIESARDQSWAPDEIIVVDDGSQDDSARIAASFPEVRLLRQPPRGVSAARNAGVDASRGELLAFLDADDRWPAKLERQVGHLLAHPDTDVVLGRQELLLEPGAPLPRWVDREGGVEAVNGSAHPLTLVTWRSIWDRVGPFSRAVANSEDTDWLLRAGELRMRITVLDDIVLVRRIHAHNVTHDDDAHRRGVVLMLKARIDRKRAAAGQ